MGGKLPKVIAHADWSTHPNKRWVASAVLNGSAYTVGPPVNLVDAGRFVTTVIRQAAPGAALIGFDFPIGLPEAYARRAGIHSFREFLQQLGSAPWHDFFVVAGRPLEISLQRPFYPARPGGTAHGHLLAGLGLDTMEQLLRRCERPYPGRNQASSLFWTLGPKQVGKAAIAGWQDVLLPALRPASGPVSLWPFDGELRELLDQGRCVLAETYPAEACLHLGFSPPGRGWSKRNPADRCAQGEHILRWASQRSVGLTPPLLESIRTGFGNSAEGEDAFDAVVGVCSMLEVVLGYREDGAPADPAVRDLEGWILGQRA